MSREVHVPFYEGLGVRFPRPTHRFGVSFGDVEDLLAQRGLTVSYEAIRLWRLTFGSAYARRLKRRQGRLGDIWHLGRGLRHHPGEREATSTEVQDLRRENSNLKQVVAETVLENRRLDHRSTTGRPHARSAD